MDVHDEDDASVNVQSDTPPDEYKLDIIRPQILFFGKLSFTVENTGNKDLTDVSSIISVKNIGIFQGIDLTNNGNIELLKPGEIKTFQTDQIKGLGRVEIKIDIESQGLSPKTETLRGFVIGQLIILL
jgi:hypothetical protein